MNKSKLNKKSSFENYTEIDLIHPKEQVESTIEAYKQHVNELYSKEFKFSNSLKLLFENYKYPLESLVGTNKQIINQNEINSIFKGISDMFSLSWTLCGELKVLIHSYNHGYSTFSIAGLFQKHAKQIKECYGRYASRFLFSIVATHNLKEVNPNFKKFYKIVKKKFQSKKLELKSIFCLPIYQIQSYYDHFLRLLNSISPDDKSYELVEDGKEFFYDLTLLLKDSLKRSIKIKEVYAIQKSIKDCPASLVHPYRILHKQFSSITDGDDPTCNIRLILFDDVIVIARKRKYHKVYVYDRAADYHIIQLIDSPPNNQGGHVISLLILSPFNDNKDSLPNKSNGKGENNNRNEDAILARADTSTSLDKKFYRFFSWTFNQNITRLNFVVESESAKKEIVDAINKRLKHLKPKPFEFFMLEAIDKHNIHQSMANLPQQISPLPEIQDILLNDNICNTLYSSIPKRLRIKRSLTLIYSMQLHGSSLSTFYERSSAGYGTAQILVIRDADDNVFGAYTSEPFHKHNGFYGNGETFLWKVELLPEKTGRCRRRRMKSISSDSTRENGVLRNTKNSRNIRNINSILSSIKNTIIPITSSKGNNLLKLSIQNNINKLPDADDSDNNESLSPTSPGSPKSPVSPKSPTMERRTIPRMASNFSASTTSSNFSTMSDTSKSKVRLYLWKQTNYFFINSTNEYVSLGSGNGKVGLWFDQQMLHGRSQVCETFRNDVLSSNEEFEIVDIELWAFTTQVEKEVQRTRPSKFSTGSTSLKQ